MATFVAGRYMTHVLFLSKETGSTISQFLFEFAYTFFCIYPMSTKFGSYSSLLAVRPPPYEARLQMH
jgi:hypothetical protein